MTKSLFKSLVPKGNKQEEIRALLRETGLATARTIAELAFKRGVFDEEMRDGFAMKGGMEFVSKALKVDDENGLPFAAPVTKDDEYLQRPLWDSGHYDFVICGRVDGLHADYKRLVRLRAECLVRFGHAPEIPEVLFASESAAA